MMATLLVNHTEMVDLSKVRQIQMIHDVVKFQNKGFDIKGAVTSCCSGKNQLTDVFDR